MYHILVNNFGLCNVDTNKKMKREQKIQEIMKLAIENGTNITTLVYVLIFQTDKGLTKFHKEFIEKNK